MPTSHQQILLSQSAAVVQSSPPTSPSGGCDLNGVSNPLSALTSQVQMAIAMESNKSCSGGGMIDQSVAVQMTEILMSTVSGINTLRNTLGEGVTRELLALLLKDQPTSYNRGRGAGGDNNSYLPVGLLDN